MQKTSTIDHGNPSLQNLGRGKVPNKVPDKSELAILQLLAVNPHLTRKELAAKIGLTENGVKKILTNLKAADLIERQGSNKSGFWI